MYLRKIATIGFLTCVAVLLAAYYIEYNYMVSPCPLCSIQRFAFICIGGMFLVLSLIKLPVIFTYIFNFLIILMSGFGATIAGRQLYLQYFSTAQETSCSASIERLIEIYPILDALKLALHGSKECASIDFTIFGLSIAVWSFILFTLIILLMVYVTILIKKRRVI